MARDGSDAAALAFSDLAATISEIEARAKIGVPGLDYTVLALLLGLRN